MVYHDRKIKQKEVDISLACEMLEYVLMNHFDVAIVISDKNFTGNSEGLVSGKESEGRGLQ